MLRQSEMMRSGWRGCARRQVNMRETRKVGIVFQMADGLLLIRSTIEPTVPIAPLLSAQPTWEVIPLQT